ncbi:aromatic amino acid lyase [bacterium]|nr:aromatic amino acid lyase [bacterium]
MGNDHHTITIGQLDIEGLYGELSQAVQNDNTTFSEYSNQTQIGLDQLRKQTNWLRLKDFASITRTDESGHFAEIVVDKSLLAENENNPVFRSYQEVLGYIRDNKNIYGVNTGFGSNRKFRLSNEADTLKLSANILYSHATGVGKPFAVDVVRGMMLLRLKTFAQGVSGVHPRLLILLRDMLNKGVIPYIPEKGSVGSSGDLCSLSHLFLVLLGKGKAWLIPNDCEEMKYTGGEEIRDPRGMTWYEENERLDRRKTGDVSVLLDGRQAMELAGIKPLMVDELFPKAGLALTNGATSSAAMLALSTYDAIQLYHIANLSGSLTHQAQFGHMRAFELPVHLIRRQKGQLLTAFELQKFLKDSTLTGRCSLIAESQDDYSIRAMPQVHGAVYNAIEHVTFVAEAEINAATDNPLFFSDLLKNKEEFWHQFGVGEKAASDPLASKNAKSTLETTHCSAANFHGEPVATAADYLKLAVAELASISERRIQLLLDSNHNRGLPANLTLGQAGLHSGFMIAQYAAAGLVSENKVLAHPSSVDSIPTSSNAEDHVAMATNAARHLRIVVQNVAHVLAIELICGLQACDIRTRYAGGYVERSTLARSHQLVNKTNKEDQLPITQYVQKYMGEDNPRMMFPNFVEEGDVSAAEILDVSYLVLSRSAQLTRSYIRDNLHIPFIIHDGEIGEEERAGSGPQQFSPTEASFKEVEPTWMIETVARAIRNGSILKVLGNECVDENL